jgi:hypothetical protein
MIEIDEDDHLTPGAKRSCIMMAFIVVAVVGMMAYASHMWGWPDETRLQDISGSATISRAFYFN